MGGWKLTTAEWTGTGTASSDNCIDIIDACKDALLANTGGNWALDTTEGYTGRITHGSDTTIAYGYYFVSGDTGAKLCMICTYGNSAFSVCNIIPVYSTSGSNFPIGLCFAMIPPNDNGDTWGTDDWTSNQWLPDIGLRATSNCINQGAYSGNRPIAASNTVNTVYSYYFLCKKDTLCVMFRASDWQQPWSNTSYSHTRGLLVGNIFELVGYESSVPYATYGTMRMGSATDMNSPCGVEGKQATSSNNISFFKNSSVLYSLTQGYSYQCLEWQCYNQDGLLCLASGNGYPKSYSADGRNPDIKTYYGGGIFPVLGISDNLNYVSVYSNQRFFRTDIQNQCLAAPFMLGLHNTQNSVSELTADFPGIHDGCGIKGIIRKDLLLGMSDPSKEFTTGKLCNNGDYVCVGPEVLLGWDPSNTNIFAQPSG